MPVLVGAGDRLITREGRASWLAKPSVPLSVWAGGHATTLAGGGSVSYQGIYEQQVWVQVAVNKLSRQIARLPLKTYRLLEGTRSEGERERVRDHPLAGLLGKPNMGRSPRWLKEKAAHPVLVHGNSLFAKGIEGPGQPPSSLTPLDWRFTTPCTDDAGNVWAWKTTQTGEEKYLDPAAVIHFAFEGGAGDVGTSPLKALGTTIRSEDAGQRLQAASFENGVRHSAVYVLPEGQEMDEEDKKYLREKLQAENGGVDRAFSLALLTGGGDIKTLTQTAVEAELIEQRKLNREEVAACYDIPPPLIGILDHATYSNVAEMHRMLYGMVLGPWLVLIEETLQAQLIDAYEPWANEGLFVEFDLAEVLKGDTLKEVQAIKEGIGSAQLTPNEGRQIRNQAPFGDPDDPANPANQLYLPANNLQPLGTESDVPGDEAPFTEVEQMSVVRRHLDRAADRLRDKGNADADRVERELATDLDDADTAKSWAARVAASSSPDEIRALAA